MAQRNKSRTAGQTKSNVSLPPNELEGWTSQAPPRRTHQTRSSMIRTTCASSTPYPLIPLSRKKKDKNYIPRPPNSFILFRHYFVQDFKAAGCKVHSGKTLSKVSAEAWKDLSEAEREEWENHAKEVGRQHALAYPGYKYRPVRSNAKPKVKSNQERQIEESSVTFHSAENSPDPGFGSPVMNGAAVPIPVNKFPTVPLDSRFIQRKQSLRLSNWDDSVLYPQDLSPNSNFFEALPYSNFIPTQGENPALVDYQYQQQLGWSLDALQRRSSSVPIPLPMHYSAANTVLPSYNNQGNIPGPSHYDPQSRRLSYSGIRPGFTFQNMGSFTQGQTALSGPSLPQVQVQVPVINAQEPSHELFGNYRISYPEVNNNSNTSLQPSLSWSSTTNPAMFISPAQEMPSTQHFNDTEHNFVPNRSHSPANVYNASPPLPSSAVGGTSTNDATSNFPSSPMLSFEEFVAANNNPGDLLNQVKSINFDVSQVHQTFEQQQGFLSESHTTERQREGDSKRDKKGKAKQMALAIPRQIREPRQSSRSTRTRTVSPLPNTNNNTYASTPETIIDRSQSPTSILFEDPVETVRSTSEGGLDSNFAMNIDPALLSITPEDPFIDFYTTPSAQDDDGTDFDSTWDLFSKEVVQM